MGYWNQSPDGISFADSELIWGDAPADIVDNAIGDIATVFIRDIGRPPTKEELLAGFKFSHYLYDETECSDG